MTNGDFQAKMGFILEQQAQLTSKVDALVGIQAHSETRLSRVEESFVLLVQMAKITDERLDTLTDKVSVLTDKVSVLTDNVEALAEAQRHTDERLNALITVVDRYISDGRNGGLQE